MRPAAPAMELAARRLAAMVEASGVLTLLCDPAGLGVHVLDGSGEAAPAAVGTTLWSWIHKDDREAAAREWETGVRSGGPFEMEWRLAGGADYDRLGKFRAAPVVDDRQPPGEWLVTLADVTEVRRATLELHEARERSRSVIAASRDGILAFGPDHVAIEWNAALERITRSPRTRVAAEPWTALFPFESPGSLLARADAMLEDGQPFLHQESFGDAARGMQRVMEFDFSPVRDARGAITGGLCQVRDVTERLLLDGRMVQNAKMDALGLLAAGIAHDFNNTLAAMLGLAELIELDLPPESPAQGTVQELMTSAHRARDLVRQILAFARQEPLHLAALDARPVVHETLRLMRKLLPASIDLQVQVPEHPVPIHADPAQLQQVLINFCTNAEHAMRTQQTGVLKVRLAVRALDATDVLHLPGLAPGAHAMLEVTDTGSGMSPEVLARVREPFFTTKRAGEGTGMGLAMVQQIIEAHRGGFEVESAVGRGTTMRVWFPLAGVPTEHLATPEPEDDPHGSGMILVLDDEPVLAHLLADALQHFGFRTRAFLRPDDAIAAFEADPYAYDAVVTDQGMPYQPGDVVAQRLLSRRPDLPVVLLTGFAPQLTPERAAQLGIAAVMTKPVSFRRLARTLVQHVGPPRDAAVASPTG